MDYWSRIEEETRLVQEATTSRSSSTVSLLHKVFSHYAEAFSLVKPSEDTKAAIVRMGLISQNFNTLRLALDAATSGYYLQSIVLLRNVYENWLAFWYVAKFPEQSGLWLDPRWDRRPPKAETMRNKIDHPTKETKSKLQGFYEELNRFAHTDPAAVLSRLRIIEGRPLVWVGVEYKPDDFAACSYALLLWLGNMLDAISSWIPETHDWYCRYQGIMDEILQFLGDYNNSYRDSSA